MSEKIEVAPLQKTPEANHLPEFIANPPLENTTFILSVPVMGEWHNGNLLRLVHSMLSQKTKTGEAFELEVVANIGHYINAVTELDMTTGDYIRDPDGKVHIKTSSEAQDEYQQRGAALSQEMSLVVEFLKKIITLQGLARKNRTDEISAIISQESDFLQRNIFILAVQKANSHALSVVDCTRATLRQTEYKYVDISSLRTLGIDTARERLKKQKNAVVGLFDVDTVFQNNNAIEVIQKYFEAKNLNYMFLGMTNFVSGYSEQFVADSGRENIRRTIGYNDELGRHGSPQILFRLTSYDKLKEIAGWSNPGFPGDEDRSTAYRLIYHFGVLQDGLLLEKGEEIDQLPPTSLTGDRVDGFVDSGARKREFEEKGAKTLLEDYHFVVTGRQNLEKLLKELPEKKQIEVQERLKKVKKEYEREQRKSQRLNHLVLSAFVHAVDSNFIVIDEDQVTFNQEKILQTVGGTALLHYLRANIELVRQVMSNQDDLIAIKYFLGSTDTLPQNFQLTSFQLSLREYICTPVVTTQLDEQISLAPDPESTFPRWKATDQRPSEERSSLLHPIIAELLSTGRILDLYFKTNKFLETRDDSDSVYKEIIRQWPKNPDEQVLEYNFGNHKERLSKIRTAMLGLDPVVEEIVYEPVAFWQKFNLKSFPIFKLFQKLTSRVT